MKLIAEDDYKIRIKLKDFLAKSCHNKKSKQAKRQQNKPKPGCRVGGVM
ncbi:hypothetical protein NG798_22900 [Ancylothrix sp. C2]|nr:hypothetical protein [Ancylothrix sp. D3o]